jgi:hypothetical protein
MKTTSTEEMKKVRLSYRRLGAMYGLVAGLAFSLSAWGPDALLLAQAHSYLPWLKFSIGLAFSILIGVLAGLLTARQDSGLVGVVTWGLAGVIYAWMAGRLPFDISTFAIGLIEPRVAGLDVYPLFRTAELRTNVFMFVIGGLAAISGALELVVLDSARTSQSFLGRGFALLAGVPFLVLAGVTFDGQVNRPLRDPLLAVETSLNFASEHRGEAIDPEKAKEMRLNAFNALGDLIYEPRRLVLGGYDEFTMVSVTVQIDFDGHWGRCAVINKIPSFCESTSGALQEELDCLTTEEECDLILSGSAERWYREYADLLQDGMKVIIEDVYGSIALVNVEVSSGVKFDCRFQEGRERTLIDCQ